MQSLVLRARTRRALNALPSLLLLSASSFAWAQAPAGGAATVAPAPAPGTATTPTAGPAIPPATGAAAAPAPDAPAAPITGSQLPPSAQGSAAFNAAAAAPPPGAAAAPADAAAAAPETPEQAREHEWAERDEAIDESATLTGGTGLLHLQHAQGLAPGQFALGFTTEFFSANFLCTSDFPCPRPGGGTAITHDTMNHFGADLTLTVGVTSWLEAYAGTSAQANSDSANNPSLLQVLGDTNLGLKAFAPLGKVVHVGAAAELWLINGTGSVGLDGAATTGKLRALGTIDLRELPKPVPLRFTVNVGYTLDNTGDTISDVEAERSAAAGKSTQITRIERYGVDINRVDHLDMGIGGELFLVDERIRPFVEYNILVPVNRQDYQCNTQNISGDNCLADDKLAPSKLTLGARFLPWKRGFNLTAAIDIGITGQNDFIEELSPVPPWNIYLGAGWNFDTQDRPPQVETKIVEKNVAPPEGHIKGYVHEVGKPEASVPNAIVAFANHTDVTSLATGADGHFNTLALPPGQYDFKVTADGYKDGVCSGTLNLDPQNEMPPMATEHETAPPPRGTVVDAVVDCALEALPRVGRILGHVRTPEKTPVANANVKLSDTAGHDFTGVADGNGAFRFEGMAPGMYKAEVTAPDYMTDVEQVEVKVRQDTPADVVLMKSAKLVTVGKSEIIIKQQIQFAFDSAVILPESNGLLTEIADTFIHNPQIHKVEIQGHTDSEGADEHNQILSEDRANAVKTWLVSHGVQTDRLDAKGYGEKKPLVPNVTAANRAKNRRVQFIIVDQEKPTPAAGAAPVKTP